MRQEENDGNGGERRWTIALIKVVKALFEGFFYSNEK